MAASREGANSAVQADRHGDVEVVLVLRIEKMLRQPGVGGADGGYAED
jgi:hypothetical protein